MQQVRHSPSVPCIARVQNVKYKMRNVNVVAEPDDEGFDVFDEVPDETAPSSTKPSQLGSDESAAGSAGKADKPERPPKRRPLSRRISKQKETTDAVVGQQPKETCTDFSDTELFEIEESETPLIPLYQIREEGAIKWVLFTDLCYLLKIKSKDTLLKLVSGHLYAHVCLNTARFQWFR